MSVQLSDGNEDTDPIAINREKEPQWINFWTRRLNEEREIYRRTLSAEAINYCNISIATDTRYRVKWVAPILDYKGPANFLFEEYREKDTGKTVVRLRKIVK